MIGAFSYLFRAVWTTLWSKDGFAAITVVLVLALTAGGIASSLAYDRGYAAADRQAEIAALESQVAVKEADLTAARNAERIARDQAEILAERAIQNQEIVNDLSAELAARPERAVCRVTDADADRLRRINAGEGGASPLPTPLSILPPARDRIGAAGR